MTGDLSIDWKDPKITNEQLLNRYGRLAPENLFNNPGKYGYCCETTAGTFATLEEAMSATAPSGTEWHDIG